MSKDGMEWSRLVKMEQDGISVGKLVKDGWMGKL
jgi:hypothetical protein